MKSWGGQCGQPPDSHSFFPLDHKQYWQASSTSTCTKPVILIVLVPSRTVRFTLKCGLCYLSQGVTVHAPCLPRQLLTGSPNRFNWAPSLAETVILMGPSWQARPTQNTCWALLQRELSNLVQPAEFPVSVTFLYISLIGKDLRKEAMTVHCIQDICTVCRYLEFLAFYTNTMATSWHDIAL